MFRLLRYYALASSLAIVVATIVLVAIYRHNATNELIATAESQNVALARSFANTLWPRFSSYVKSVSGVKPVSGADGDALRARPETREIHQMLAALTAGVPVLKVKIYSLDGLTVYSSEPSQIGGDKSDNPGFRAAAEEGRSASELSFRDTFSAFSGVVANRDLVESYLPIRGGDGAIEGVFELYSDVSPLVDRIDRTTTRLTVVLLVIFGFLYGVLSLIVRHADRILRRQYAEFAENKRLIEARNAALEHLITERGQAEHAVREGERRYRELFEASPISILEQDWSEAKKLIDAARAGGVEDLLSHFRDHPDFLVRVVAAMRIVNVNPVTVEMFGARDESDLIEKINARIRRTPLEGTAERLAALAEGAARVSSEYTTVRLDGTPFDARVAISIPPAHGADWSRVLVAVEDITERTSARKALQEAHDTLEQRVRESESRFRAVVDHSPTKIHIKDAEGRYTLVNRYAAKLFGVTGEEALGKTTHEIFPDAIAASFAGHDRAVMDSGQPVEQEEEWSCADGIRTYLTVKFPILDADGRIGGVGAIGTDITERKRAEEALERLRHRSELILNSAAEGIYGLDSEGRTSFVNPAAAQMIGWDAEDLIGKRQHDILHHTKRDGTSYPRDECPIYASSRDGRVRHVTNEVFWRKDGASFPVEYISSPIREDGAPVGAVVVFRDITEREYAEEKLRAAKEQSELANRAKSEFLANMSHELRTPLNAIIGFSELIRDETFGPVGSPKYIEYVKDIHESGRHLLELINDILDLSKIEAGKAEIHEESVDVPKAVNSCLTLVKERAETAGVELKVEFFRHLPALHADKRKLKQILVNLLSNGIKFTQPGGKVRLKAWTSVDDGYVFQVIDTGIGIARQDIPNALAAFRQIDSALNRKYEGSGLGLPLTRALVELHGGSLDLQSEVGIGTSVTIRFPAERIVSQAATGT